MSSLFKAGKKLVDEFKPMITPNRNNTQYQSQSPYASAAQPYPSPSTGLSPYFHQQPVQANSSTNLHANTLQYGSPQQPPAPGTYLNPQTQPQQSQYSYSAVQSPQVQPATPQPPQWSQQVPPVQQHSLSNQGYQPQVQQYQQTPQQTPLPQYQQTQFHQYTSAQQQQYQQGQTQSPYQAQAQQYQQQASSPQNSLSPPPQVNTPFQSPGNQYPQQQYQQHQQYQQYPQHQQHQQNQQSQQHQQYQQYQPQAVSPQQSLPSPPRFHAPSQPPGNQYSQQQLQQHSNITHNSNPNPSPVASPPSSVPPRQASSPPASNTSTWQTPAAPATSGTSATFPAPSAVELPGEGVIVASEEQTPRASLPPVDNVASPTVTVASVPSQMPVEQPRPQPPSSSALAQGWTVAELQTPEPQIPETHPNPPAISSSLQPQVLATSPAPQPGNSAQGSSYPPNTHPTTIPPASQQQQVQSPVMNFPPPPQWQHHSAPYHQSLMPWQQNQQQEQHVQLQAYQPANLPPLSSSYQPFPQANQMINLQQGMEALSVTPAPALSPSFREVASPVPAPAPSRKAPKNEPEPSVLRVQTEGHASALRKILCLDGGGVRGLASLMIVKHLMDRLEQQRGGRLEPWQEFDMIAGTSTGGLIAIMLGRLRMSVAEAIEAYKTLSQRIFTPVHSKGNVAGRALATLRADGKFESEPLELVVKEMCRKEGLSETELLKDDRDDSPKVFVCAAQGINADTVVIRSYRSGDGEWDDLYDICKIWEAARATSAASTFFPPIQIGYQKYVDGALRYNNPIEKADQESRELWPNQERLIVSVGTGAAPGPNVLASNIADLGKALAKLVTDTEDENARFRKRNKDMVENNLLFRFNVLHGLADVRLNEWEALGEIMAHTGTYMKSPDTATAFNKCANMMKTSGQRLGYIAGEDLDAYQRFQAMSTIYAEFCEDCHRGIPYLEKMFLCIECQLFTCEDCHDSHEPSHLRNMLRFNVMQWMEKLPTGIEPSASCRYCAKDAKSRWECQQCDKALCRNCVTYHDRRIEFFKEHREMHPDHRSFFATYPPFWSTETQWVTSDCQCLSMTWFGGHCERCNRVFAGGERGYFCRTCRSGFGSSQSLCLQCFERDEEHTEKHQFGTFEVVYEDSGPDNVQEAIKKLWGCSQCPERFAEGKHQSHIHLHLRLIITPLVLELYRRAAYRSCRRKEIMDNSTEVVNPVPIRCALCTKHLAFDKGGSLCLKKDCGDCFCAECTLANRHGHRHYLYKFTVMRSVKNYLNQIMCAYCQQAYILATAQGLWCADCKNHFICIKCIMGIEKSDTPKVQEGLPHMKILKPCKVKNEWQLYLMDGT